MWAHGLSARGRASLPSGVRRAVATCIAAACVMSSDRLATAQDAAKPLGGTSMLVPVQLGSSTVHLRITQGPLQGPLYINLHENESTSRRLAEQLVAKQGGTLIALEAGGERDVAFIWRGRSITFDPNRIFTSDGLRMTLAARNRAAVPQAARAEVQRLATEILRQVEANPQRPVIALHNNADRRAQFSVLTYRNAAELARWVQQADTSNTHAFFLVTSEDTGRRLVNLGFSVVLQATRPIDDGSLSVWAALLQREYVNVEAALDAEDMQRRMLQAVARLCDDRGCARP